MCGGGSKMGARAFNLLAVALLIQYVARADSVEGTNGGGGVHGDASLRQHQSQPQQQQQPLPQPQRVDSIGVDFAAYVNDFNMQDEAAIPEDILDQQHIQDADAAIDAVELQYGEYGETEAADIILESRRSTSRNFSIYDESENSSRNNNNKWDTSSSNNKQNKNSSSSSSSKKKQQNNNNKQNHYNKFKNRKDIFDDGDQQHDKKIDNSNNNDDNDDDEYSNADELATQTMSKTSGNGAVYKKFKSIHDKENKKHPKKQQQQQRNQNPQQFAETEGLQQKPQEQQKQQKQGQQHQQMKAIETLNERKSNKAAQDDSNRSSSSNNNGKSNINANRYKNTADESGDIKLTETAIGDIEDNFRNEDGTAEEGEAVEAASAVAGTNINSYNNNNNKELEEYEHHEDDESIATSIDKDESAATAAATTALEASAVNVAVAKQSSAVVVVEATGATLIPRKTKRHNGVSRPNYFDEDDDSDTDTDTYQAGKQRRLKERWYRPVNAEKKYTDYEDEIEYQNVGDEMQQQQQQQPQQQLQLQAKQSRAEPTKVQTDYSISYFGILTNGSNTADDTSSLVNGSSGSGGAGATFPRAKGKTVDFGGGGGDVAEDVDEETASVSASVTAHSIVHSHAKHAAATAAAQSAFEQHKAQRRNSRRNGHKSHKKKYKDYLRFVMSTTAAATTTIPTAAAATTTIIVSDIVANAFNATSAKLTNVTKGNYQQQDFVPSAAAAKLTAAQRAEKLRQHARKLQAEKSRGLPASPIFALSGAAINRNRNIAAEASATETVAEEAETATTPKPFYEGQVNYYVETKDDEYERKLPPLTSVDARQQQHTSNIDRMIAADNGNWYRRVSPVLRNGIKSSSAYGSDGTASKLLEERLKRPLQAHQHHHQQQQHRQQQQQLHHHHTHHHRKPHHHHHKHQSSSSSSQHHGKHFARNPYQRKLMLPPQKQQHSKIIASNSASQTPLPPPSHKGAMQELGHQITEMEEFERYYAKWPHLARVQFQVYDEHYREAHPEIYADYDDDYESAAELEEAQSGRDEDANLPPYIKKYNRRNKQLLNLLEGTLPPPTTRQQATLRWSGGSLLQPGSKDSSSAGGKPLSVPAVRIDDDYLKEKRRRYHNRGSSSTSSHHFKDLFALQRKGANGNDPNSAYVSSTTEGSSFQRNGEREQLPPPHMLNQLPDEDLSISREEMEEEDDANWQREIETKSNKFRAGSAQMTWQIEKLTATAAPPTTTTTSTTATSRPTPKAAIFKLPSYPAIAGSFIGKPRSRSAQFAPSSSGGGGSGNGGSRANIFGYGFGGGSSVASNKYKSMPRFAADRPVTSTAAPPLAPTTTAAAAISAVGVEAAGTTPPPPPTINASFVYHRVVDASPRLVGAGATGRKQRLPFVAITDRRLETSKRTLLERQKDFEQNYFPMP